MLKELILCMISTYSFDLMSNTFSLKDHIYINIFRKMYSTTQMVSMINQLKLTKRSKELLDFSVSNICHFQDYLSHRNFLLTDKNSFQRSLHKKITWFHKMGNRPRHHGIYIHSINFLKGLHVLVSWDIFGTYWLYPLLETTT